MALRLAAPLTNFAGTVLLERYARDLSTQMLRDVSEIDSCLIVTRQLVSEHTAHRR